MTTIPRPRFLLLALLVGAVAFAGCTGDDGPGGDATEGTAGQDDPLLPGENANEHVGNQIPEEGGAEGGPAGSG